MQAPNKNQHIEQDITQFLLINSHQIYEEILARRH